MVPLFLACSAPPPVSGPPTVLSVPPAGDTSPTGDTSPPGPPPVPRALPAVTPWGVLVVEGVRLSPYVTDLALTDAGSVCLSGHAWATGPPDSGSEFGGLGSAVVARVDPAGTLDAGFGGDGIVELPGTVGTFASAAAPDDGCYVAVGTAGAGTWAYYASGAAVVRVDAAGTVDAGFASPVFDHDGTFEQIHELAALEDGGVLVLGTGRTTAWVARLGADGALDPTWADHGEAVLPPLGLDCEATSFCDAGGLAVLPDGRVRAWVGHPAAVVALDAAGSVDAAYGAFGVAAPSGAFRVSGMAATWDGTVVLGGAAHDGTSNLPRVERLGPTGAVTVPASWLPVAAPGTYATVYGLDVDGDGRAVLVGEAGPPIVVRALEDGTLDPAWGAGGVSSAFPYASAGDSGAVAVAGNGTVVSAALDLGAEQVLVAALAP